MPQRLGVVEMRRAFYWCRESNPSFSFAVRRYIIILIIIMVDD
jgi:hypothetical protein